MNTSLISLLFWMAVGVHDIHISVTEITVNQSSIEVVSKIFLDDLQAAMGLVPGEELPENYKGSNELIQEFVNENLVLKINGKAFPLTLSGTTSALPAVWS